jgi:RNA polymerase sigma-70 factor (ECF subfamily)
MPAVRVVPRQSAPRPDENRMIERVLAGDRDAYAFFVRAYQRRVFGLAMRLLRDRGEAECVAQEAFLKAYQGLGDFQGGASFETWVSRIAINACRDRLKRKKIVRFFHQAAARDGEEGDPAALSPAPDPAPDRLAYAGEIRRRLEEAVESLSPRQKIVFTLKHMEERSIPEIAELMGLDAGTVKSHLFRAGRKVRSLLQDLRRTP